MTDRAESLADQTVGVVFAGGAARRLGGIDKGSIELGGQTLLARSATRLATQSREVVLSTRDTPTDSGDLVRIADDASFAEGGPLVALLSVLRWVRAEREARFVLTSPVDTPFLPLDLRARLADALLDRGARSAVAVCGDRIHGLSALYALDALADVEQLVERGERMVQAMHLALGSAPAHFETRPYDPFLNINTEQDLDAAQALAARLPADG